MEQGGYFLTGSDKVKIVETYDHNMKSALNFTHNLYGEGDAGHSIVYEIDNFNRV